MEFNIHEAKAQLSRLLELVQAGEPVIIARHGTPIAELIPFRSKGFPFGAAKGNLLTPAGDEWWQPMPNDEADDWVGGQGGC